jgi:phosphatidylserine/phosphatidylglycerophosphate/cardiolipin synthase-like enzyme
MIEAISGKQFGKVVTPLINQAKEKIDIVVFDWRWYGKDPGASVQLFNQAIVRAVRRRVSIRAITNSTTVIDILKQNGLIAKKIISKKLMHVKLMIIDDKAFVIGSHNYSMSAFELNEELSVYVTDEKNIDSIIQFYENLWSR